jgi:hypothetical protein
MRPNTHDSCLVHPFLPTNGSRMQLPKFCSLVIFIANFGDEQSPKNKFTHNTSSSDTFKLRFNAVPSYCCTFETKYIYIGSPQKLLLSENSAVRSVGVSYWFQATDNELVSSFCALQVGACLITAYILPWRHHISCLLHFLSRSQTVLLPVWDRLHAAGMLSELREVTL